MSDEVDKNEPTLKDEPVDIHGPKDQEIIAGGSAKDEAVKTDKLDGVQYVKVESLPYLGFRLKHMRHVKYVADCILVVRGFLPNVRGKSASDAVELRLRKKDKLFKIVHCKSFLRAKLKKRVKSFLENELNKETKSHTTASTPSTNAADVPLADVTNSAENQLDEDEKNCVCLKITVSQSLKNTASHNFQSNLSKEMAKKVLEDSSDDLNVTPPPAHSEEPVEPDNKNVTIDEAKNVTIDEAMDKGPLDKHSDNTSTTQSSQDKNEAARKAKKRKSTEMEKKEDNVEESMGTSTMIQSAQEKSSSKKMKGEMDVMGEKSPNAGPEHSSQSSTSALKAEKKAAKRAAKKMKKKSGEERKKNEEPQIDAVYVRIQGPKRDSNYAKNFLDSLLDKGVIHKIAGEKEKYDFPLETKEGQQTTTTIAKASIHDEYYCWLYYDKNKGKFDAQKAEGKRFRNHHWKKKRGAAAIKPSEQELNNPTAPDDQPTEMPTTSASSSSKPIDDSASVDAGADSVDQMTARIAKMSTAPDDSTYDKDLGTEV